MPNLIRSRGYDRWLGPLLTVLLLGSAAGSTIDPTSKFAYSANAGWISFRHDQPASPAGIVFGEYYLSGFAYGANVGWFDFGDGSPVDGIQYQNNSATDYGVNHDGSGNLGGFAYGANIGWINFGWAAPNDANRPRVDLLTGAFHGFAYSANLGWINLGAGYLTTDTITTADSDSDGIADAWERSTFGDLTTATATSDSDGDGTSDLKEYLAGTDPENGAASLRIVSHTYNPSFTEATVVFPTDPARVYRLETSDDLVVWTNSAHGTFAPDAGPETTKVVSWPSTAQKFLRVIVSRPLQ